MIGIYKITNLDNGKMYVGQSVNIENRWSSHKTLLNKNQHENRRLQNSWNVHGADRYEFSAIEECSIEELNDLEMYWIDKLRTYVGFDDCNGYNETIGGDGNRLLTQDIVKPICDLYNSGQFDTVPKLAEYLKWESKKVRRYLFYGNIYGFCNYDPTNKISESHKVKVICLNDFRVFNSAKEAEEYYGIHGVASCCVGKLKYAGKDSDNTPLMWLHYDDYVKMQENEIKEYIENLKDEIYAYFVVCLNNGVVFTNSVEAASHIGVKAHTGIQNCCNGKTKHCGKNNETGEYYVWLYYKDYKKLTQDEINKKLENGQVSTTNPPKKVICLNNLKMFESPKDASIWALNTNQTCIKNCCLGMTNSAGNSPDDTSLLTWMYYDEYIKTNHDFIDNKLLLSKYKRTNPERSKMIVCLNNNYLFFNQKDAAIWCGLKNHSNIGYCIRNNKYAGRHPETNEKLRWMYYEDYIKEFDESTLIKYQGVYFFD